MTTKRAAPEAEPQTPQPVPLREVVAANIRAIAGRDKVAMGDLAERLGRPRQWVHRRTSAGGPITTEDIDTFAAALDVSTDELTRRA